MIISKAVITAAGIGSRLLPVTKEMPKEMLPVFCRRRSKALCLKPVVQVVFETLFDAGTRTFCMVVGRGKRAVEDYFTADRGFISLISKGGKGSLTAELSEFYRRLGKSSIAFVNQAEPLGFGDAVLCSAEFVGSDPFLLHAGDDLILSPGNDHMRRLKSAFTSLGADVMFFVEHTRHPEKYGVIRPKRIGADLYRVKELVEKPKHPPSDLGVVAIYAFQPSVIDYLKRVKADQNGEFQLADAVQMMVEDKKKVFAIALRRSEKRVDMGSPDTYRLALKQTFR